MKKKLLSMLLCTMLALPVALCAGCGEESTPTGGGNSTGGGNAAQTYDIVVWVGEGTDVLTKNQIAKFNEENEWGVKFNARVEIVSESKAAGDVISTPESAADIFCFAQDQLARLVAWQRLGALNPASVEAVNLSDEGSVQATKIGDKVRAFPLTADNGYFMYYDKRVVPEEHVGSLEAIIEDCKAAKENFSMNLTGEGGSWYAASFFYATGCKSEWQTDEDGKFTTHEDTFDSPEGIIALKGMQKLFKSGTYQASAEISDLTAAIPSAVVVSGIWSYNAAKTALGDNLGIAPLPSFNVDGKDYQLTTYLGRKLLGVTPQSDPYRALYIQKLAIYLTGEECQRQRFEAVKWGPSNSNLQADPTITTDALQALAASKTTPQGQYPTNWWAKLEIVTETVRKGTDDEATLSAALHTYSDSLAGLKD